MSLRTPDRQMSSSPRCDRPVQGDGIMSYHCSLPQGHAEDTLIPGDPQPCFAVESSRSTRTWDAWKARQEEANQQPDTLTIRCPQCQRMAMVIGEGGAGRCSACGVEAEAQQDLPTQPPESIEEIEKPGEPWLVVAHPDQIGEPTKQREGDQRLPNEGDAIVQDWIVAQMMESKRVGIERYGQPLMTFDGRLNIRDLAEELRDAFVYVSKLQMMAQADRETLVRVVGEALTTINDATYPMTTEQVAEAAVDTILDWVLAQRIGPEQIAPQAEGDVE